MNQEPRGRLWIGPSGWSYGDWYGVLYPQPRSAGFEPLAYLARFFNAVEVNSSFYRIPAPRMTQAWVRQVPREFRFAFKLTRIFTHERTEFPGQREVEAFTDGLRPVQEAGLLGPLLMQFPWSFRYTSDAVQRLRRLADAFPDFDRFVEVRHASWAQPEALADLAAAGGHCNIDQPRLRNCLGPAEHVFGRNAYVRLHGRNARNWFAEDVPNYERYNYLYGGDELHEWVNRLDAMGGRAENLYVFANNHYRGQGPVNALELKALLEGGKVAVPDELRAAYPRLAAIARPPRAPQLFEPSE